MELTLLIELAMLIYNCYVIQSKIVKSSKEIRSRKGKIQGDPTAMVTYTIGLTPLLDDLQSVSSATKHAEFADDLTGAKKLVSKFLTSQPS